jgi:ankyrin repeat protein
LFYLHRFDSGIHSGSTPLHASSAFGHLEVCQFLVEKRANVNATRNEYDIQPYAYTYEHSLMIFVLIKRFDSGTLSGTTPLLWSSVRGNLEVCQFLVQKRANVNAKDNQYDTQPYACTHEHSLIAFVSFATF